MNVAMLNFIEANWEAFIESCEELGIEEPEAEEWYQEERRKEFGG